MTAQPVEWVLVIRYVREVHRQTYGRRVRSDRYTKDYIQLSRRPEFLEAMTRAFPVAAGSAQSVPLTYVWPHGTAPGAFVFRSADRPHLKWETSAGTPQVWKMHPTPTDAIAETIPGDPMHLDFEAAERQFDDLANRGAGQPFLVAVKLRDEPTTLHLRAYLAHPDPAYSWADIDLLPFGIRDLAAATTNRRAVAQTFFQSGGVAASADIETALNELELAENPGAVIDSFDEALGRALADYLQHPGYGLFFDPAKNHDAWVQPAPLPGDLALSASEFVGALRDRFPAIPLSDIAAEDADADPTEVETFHSQMDRHDYSVPDSIATVKTRGSAQRAFADAVKANYGYRCAVTGIATSEFLVASHIVPWSEDTTIRLDPANGICLSLLVDRAFETGALIIDDDLVLHVDTRRIGDDDALLAQFAPYEGLSLRSPTKHAPKPEYLRRRRDLVAGRTEATGV